MGKPAVIVFSETPVEPHVWAQLAMFGVEPEDGAVYHWVADPDEGGAWCMVEMPDGAVIAGAWPQTLRELDEGHMRGDGETWERLADDALAAIRSAMTRAKRRRA